MFKFITLAFICMIVMAGVEATKLQSNNMVRAKSQAKALVAALENLKETMEVMEENGEIENNDFDFNSILDGAKRLFHFWTWAEAYHALQLFELLSYYILCNSF